MPIGRNATKVLSIVSGSIYKVTRDQHHADESRPRHMNVSLVCHVRHCQTIDREERTDADTTLLLELRHV